MKLEGLPVYDATEPITFTVTKRDANKGGIKDPESCAMALACKREQHSKDVRIHINYSYVLQKDHWLRYRTPACVGREIIAFDRGGTFDPGEYMLLVPFKSNRLNHVKKHDPIRIGRRGKQMAKKRYMHITTNVRTRPVFSSRIIHGTGKADL
jgi:hypothetical protein